MPKSNLGEAFFLPQTEIGAVLSRCYWAARNGPRGATLLQAVPLAHWLSWFARGCINLMFGDSDPRCGSPAPACRGEPRSKLASNHSKGNCQRVAGRGLSRVRSASIRTRAFTRGAGIFVKIRAGHTWAAGVLTKGSKSQERQS